MAVLLIVNPINVVLPFMIAVIIAGIIGTARLILKAHLPGDIWLGYIIGILVQFLAYWYMK
jgi:membrane-associated phospholipid phosphatase